MVSINGIEVKDVKSFKGHEGEDLLQGNIYYNGRLLGFWTQDSWGGPDSYRFSTAELKDEIESYIASDRVPNQFKAVASLDTLIADILLLEDIKKAYDKNVKAAYLTTVVVTEKINMHCIGYQSSDKEETAIALADKIKEYKKKCFEWYPVSVQYFNSPEDFIVNTMDTPSVVKRRGR